MKTYVLYHAGCYDGFGAAYAAWKHFGSEAKYLPVSYNGKVPNIEDGSDVFIVDFSYKRQVLLELSARCNVVVLDHHATAQEDLKGLSFAKFDMSKSGAGLTWEYFHAGEEMPDLIKHIQDRDLWKFEMPGSKEVHVYLQSINMDFEAWDRVNVLEAIEKGKSITQFRDRQVEVICERAKIYGLLGHIVPVINTTVFWSEVGNRLLEMYPNNPFAATFYHTQDDMIAYSLRSRKDFDVAQLASTMGGGGHKQAAGFKVEYTIHVKYNG